jgi:hypothetical protein
MGVLNLVACIATFRRRISSLYFLSAMMVVVPLVFFVAINVMLSGAWWEWYILIVEMGIPIIFAWYMLKDPRVKTFFVMEK